MPLFLICIKLLDVDDVDVKYNNVFVEAFIVCIVLLVDNVPVIIEFPFICSFPWTINFAVVKFVDVPIPTLPIMLKIFTPCLFHTFKYEFDISSFPNICISWISNCVAVVPIRDPNTQPIYKNGISNNNDNVFVVIDEAYVAPNNSLASVISIYVMASFDP